MGRVKRARSVHDAQTNEQFNPSRAAPVAVRPVWIAAQSESAERLSFALPPAVDMH
jgi:hypothetical protein